MSLVEQIDYRGKLREQFPAAAHRVVYSSSGMHIAAARVMNPTAVVNDSLYWAAAASEPEAHYLTAILNSPVTTTRVRPLMAFSKLERHIHKHVWKLPIPLFDGTNAVHRQIADLGAAMEREVAAFNHSNRHFTSVRRALRKIVSESANGREIDSLVTGILGPAE